MSIPVALHLWIISQVIAFIALVVIIWAFQVRSKTKTLFLVVIFNALMAASTMLLGNWIMVGIYSLAVVRDLVFLWRERKYPDNRAISLATLVTFLIASTVIAVFTIDWAADAPFLALFIIVQLVALFNIFGSWAKGCHLIRISRISFASVVMINHIVFANYTAVVIEAFSLVAVMVFYIRLFLNKRVN